MNIFKWFSEQPNKIGFEDVKRSISKMISMQTILINTLPSDEQSCLIKTTINSSQEESIINDWIQKNDFKTKNIIIYGKNATDNSVFDKYKQLSGIGFSNIYIYGGGMFEWLLLQDVYGFSDFPTTIQNADLLKYREPSLLL